MAMRGALTHRKTRRLAKVLGIPLPCALGVMEALWHVTAEQAPTGAIGRLSNQDIADEMFWEGDADELIQAFLTTELLEEHEQFRLIVHNYHKYADQATKRKVGRHGLTFAVSEHSMTSHDSTMTSHDWPTSTSTSTRDQKPESEDKSADSQPAPTKRFVAPTDKEAAQYAKEINLPGQEAKKYFEHYNSNGWKVGKNPMKDWKAAMRKWKLTWETDQKPANQNGKSVGHIATDEELDRVNRPWAYAEQAGGAN